MNHGGDTPQHPPRVVITGAGWVTPLGHSVAQTWEALIAGRSGVGKITRFDAATFKTNFAAEVKGFTLADHVPEAIAREHHSAGLNAQFALAAAKQALEQAGIDVQAPNAASAAAHAAGAAAHGASAATHAASAAAHAPGAAAHAAAAATKAGGRPSINPRRFGLYLGSGEGSLDFPNYAHSHIAGWDDAARKVDGKKWAAAAMATMSPIREIEQEANMTLSHVAWAFGCRGPASNCLTACAASIQAIGEAYELLRRGDADVMLAGGAHTMVHPLGVTGFIRLTALSARSDDFASVPRPFDATRDGFVMGEGAGIIVMETLEHALGRGVRPENILAEVRGYGSSADAFRITDMHPQGEGPAAAMRSALAQAGIDPRSVGPDGRPGVQWISAHGTGTKENDKIETAAIKSVFGELAPKIPISSIKSMLGHLIAAAGVSNVIASMMSIRTGLVPPTINLRTPDAGLDLDYVPNVVRDARATGGIDACLCNAYGFGGQNDCVVIGRFVP
jgi:3-oxoacyl-[acyl-carrier-protein] synthase II